MSLIKKFGCCCVEWCRDRGNWRFCSSLAIVLVCWGMVVNNSIAAPAFNQRALAQQTSSALAQQAMVAQTQGDFSQAKSIWDELLQRYPDNAALWSNRGNTQVSLGNWLAAIADYEQAIVLAPAEPDPYLNRGTVYEAQGRWQDAIADYNQVLELNAQDAAAYNNRGNAYAGLGQWEQALEDYQTAVTLQPNFALARNNVAIALYQQGRTKQALQQLRSLTRKYPVFADSRAALTAVLWSQGFSGKAESNWVAVMGLDTRYRDLEWVTEIRRWPPRLLEALTRFLAMETD